MKYLKYLIVIILTMIASWSVLFWVILLLTREVKGPLPWRPDHSPKF
jgi:hypothetical protein